MPNVKLLVSGKELTLDSEYSLGDKAVLYLMEGDIDSVVMGGHFENNILEINVVVDDKIYEKLKYEEDRILDITELYLGVNGKSCKDWTYEGFKLI